MQIYNAHPITREYLGQSLADPDPLEDGAWLVPAHAYLDAPPAIPAGQAARRVEDGSAWELVDDHRGTVYSTATGEAQQHAELGELPEGLTDQPRPSKYDVWSGSAWELDTVAEADGLAATERAWRDGAMVVPCGMRDRHRDEVELGIGTTLTVEQFEELLGYIQALRDWPQSAQFPAIESRPAPPAWLSAG